MGYDKLLFMTRAASATSDPQWDQGFEWNEAPDDDRSLEFRIWDSDLLFGTERHRLGTAELRNPTDFEGELPLKKAAGGTEKAPGSLKVSVKFVTSPRGPAAGGAVAADLPAMTATKSHAKKK